MTWFIDRKGFWFSLGHFITLCMVTGPLRKGTSHPFVHSTNTYCTTVIYLVHFSPQDLSFCMQNRCQWKGKGKISLPGKELLLDGLGFLMHASAQVLPHTHWKFFRFPAHVVPVQIRKLYLLNTHYFQELRGWWRETEE